MIELHGRQWSRAELHEATGSMDQLAGIKLVEGGDGLARGLRALRFWTGSGLTFDVLADRALDIGACQYNGASLCWLSPVGEAHPAFYEPHGLGWLRTYGGGLFVTCGLDHFGGAYDYPEGPVGVHGRISNLPARAVSYRSAWVGDEYVLEASGVVRQGLIYGENMVLERRISSALGSRRIRIEDTITNEGYAPQRHQITYHFNLGFPLLSADTRLKVEVSETVPHDDASAAGLAQWRTMQAPTPGWKQQNFWHTPVPDAQGRVTVQVESPVLGLGLRWGYDATWLPYLLEWKSMSQGAYVLGIEPGNTRGVSGRGAVRDLSELPHLAPGERRQYAIDVEVFEV
jgi:hypothetical protein